MFFFLQKIGESYFPLHSLFFFLQKIGERVTEDQLHDILNEVDVNKNAQVDIGEFLQVCIVSILYSEDWKEPNEKDNC